MSKIIFILIVIMTLTSLVYAASLKKCKIVKSNEVCEPANEFGKFVKNNFGISL